MTLEEKDASMPIVESKSIVQPVKKKKRCETEEKR